MSIAKASIHKTLYSNPDIQVKDLVCRVNGDLSQNNTNCMFLTLIVGIFDPETGIIHITNAGHNSPYIKKANGNLVLLDQVDGPMIGTFKEASFGQQSIKLDEGDTLLFYTDGITDAQNFNEEFYKQDRLEKTLRQQHFTSPGHMINSITKNVMNFIGKQDQFDDITILSLSYSPQTKTS